MQHDSYFDRPVTGKRPCLLIAMAPVYSAGFHDIIIAQTWQNFSRATGDIYNSFHRLSGTIHVELNGICV